jgi:ParB/RepB/Spo0J family partition protein
MKTQFKSEVGDGVLKEIALDDMEPWDGQPRKNFPEAKHKEMVKSIREFGVIQPLVVRLVPGAPARGPMPKELEGKPRHQIIAGERRWRGAKGADKKTVLCVLRNLTDRQALELALVENLDRHDLDVFEEADGYHALIGLGYTVIELGERFGKSREYIYARLDLRALGEEERSAVRDGGLVVAVARELAKVPPQERKQALDEVLHPKYLPGPMPFSQAVSHLKTNFVQPAKAAEKWEKGRKDLEKQFPNAEVMNYSEGLALLQHGSGWVRVSEKPKSWEVVERLRKDVSEIPCWGDLGERYGAKVRIVPGDEDEVIRMVERKVIIEGDIVNSKAGDCVFVKPRGEEDEKLERQAEERRKKAEIARQAAKQKELKGFFEELLTAGIEGVLPSLVRLRMDEDICVELYNVMHGTELKGYDEGDAELVTPWALDVVKKGGLKAYLWIELAEVLMNSHRGIKFGDVADAAGMKRGDWPALCAEDEEED